jgi:phenylacetate-coenzyme A ligase PaaK-like adenylate-forming protein
MEIQSESIFQIMEDADFKKIAINQLRYQYENNLILNRYYNALNIKIECISELNEIRFLPIELFKSNEIICGKPEVKHVFSSSGTTGQITSKHFVKDISMYEKSFFKCFEMFYGRPEAYCFLFLLPSYLERAGSSLVYMAENLVKKSGNNSSGFYLNNYEELKNKILEQNYKGEKTILFGVTYALLDLCELDIALDENFIVIETGGMKGKRKEITKQELHNILKEKLKINAVHSEYGMTELLSQAYSKRDGIFKCPPWMKILIRDPYSPNEYFPQGRVGAINVIDLANLYSCSFIATQDLGRDLGDGKFEILGRMNDAELRGCNLMID